MHKLCHQDAAGQGYFNEAAPQVAAAQSGGTAKRFNDTPRTEPFLKSKARPANPPQAETAQSRGTAKSPSANRVRARDLKRLAGVRQPQSALEHNVRHHVECKQTFDGAAATAKVDRKNKTSAASARAMPKTIRRLQQQRATRGSEKSMRTIPSCTLISDTICMSTSASHVIASIHELDDITAMLAPSPPALLRQLDHPVLLCNRSLGPAEFFRVVNYAAAQHLADVPVALPDLTEVRPFSKLRVRSVLPRSAA